MDSHEHSLINNYRPVQPLNGRKVFASVELSDSCEESPDNDHENESDNVVTINNSSSMIAIIAIYNRLRFG